MKHFLFIRNEFGDFCAGCGVSAAFSQQADCTLMHIRKEVQELYHWQHSEKATNFTAQLFSLFQKADALNYQKLAKAFPKEAAALTLWHQCEDEEQFYAVVGLSPERRSALD